MIDEHSMRYQLEERRLALRRSVEANRLVAAARAGHPRVRRLDALRATVGLAVARLGLRLAGPVAARARSRQS